MKTLTLTILFFVLTAGMIAGSTAHRDYDPLRLGSNGILKDPPLCMVDGTKVVYHLLPAESLWNNGAGLGQIAIDDNDKPVVALDKDHLPLFTPEFQLWLMMHECAHHQLHHWPSSAATGSSAYNHEKEADVLALVVLASMGFTAEHFAKIISDIQNHDKMKVALSGVVAFPEIVNAHPWTLEERAEFNTQQLLKIAGIKL